MSTNGSVGEWLSQSDLNTDVERHCRFKSGPNHYCDRRLVCIPILWYGLWMVNHGTNTSYIYGCRCDECTTAHRETNRKYYSVGGRKRPPRWGVEVLSAAVKSSVSFSEVLRKLGILPTGGNWSTLKKYISQYALDITHFTNLPTQRRSVKMRPLDELLTINSWAKRETLKRRLISERRLSYRCEICGLTEWNRMPVCLQLDHINGIPTDNRIENLRLLCPNCHSQTDTFCGKNITRPLVSK